MKTLVAPTVFISDRLRNVKNYKKRLRAAPVVIPAASQQARPQWANWTRGRTERRVLVRAMTQQAASPNKADGGQW
ncbi:MAG: hypothetical protein E5V72_19260 [Mesorhizobium sp.]|nr:MAG: hypothetical protein E5V72_19260 [Mesorhizobium sp.]